MPSISSVDNVASCSAEKSTEAMLVEAMILDRSSVVELVRNLVKRQEPNVLDLWSYVLSIEYIRCTIASSQTDSDCLSARFGRRHRRRFFNRRVLSGAYKQAFSAREIAQSARHFTLTAEGKCSDSVTVCRADRRRFVFSSYLQSPCPPSFLFASP